MMKRYVSLCLALLCGTCLLADSKAVASVLNKYMSMSIRELMNIKITSVSKKEESLSDAAAAVYVITQEDIRHSGATSIPEVLRLAPGIQVAQIDANKWAITSRGFNGMYANKLLVLIDGRTVYTPLYSGVYWDVQDTMLEDIDRIEVIRGPGATLWGANAVNGVINVITKSAKSSQGLLIAGGAGNQERGFGQVRYGGRLGNLSYRIYSKGFYRASYPYGQLAQEDSLGLLRKGEDASDQWASGRAGFRTDWDMDERNHLTFQGDIYTGYDNTTVDYRFNQYVGILDHKADFFGGNIIARWKHSFDPGSELSLQLYYDRIGHDQYGYDVERDTFDFDIQQTFPLPWRQKVISGFAYRYSTDRIETTSPFRLDPRDKALHWISGFIQDEIALVPNKLRFIFGSKFENNEYTGFEFQPSARIIWKPTSNQAIWAAVSRAVRTPSRADTSVDVTAWDVPAGRGDEFDLPGNFGIRAHFLGDEDYDSETVTAYELGYRSLVTPTISVDIATFFNDYNRLRTVEPYGAPRFDPATMQVLQDYKIQNHQFGTTYGIEVVATWKVRKFWKITSTYSWMNYDLDYDSGVENVWISPSELSPRQQFSVRSYLDMPFGLEFDSFLYYSDGLDGYAVPSYTRLDLRFGWRPYRGVEASLMLENLLDDQHPEFGGYFEGIVPTEVPRSFYAKITFKF